MADNDRESLYFGRVLDFGAQSACRDRVDWMCARVVGSRVLDVGCSQGIVSIILGREGYAVVGIDMEEELIETARQALQDEPADLRQRVEFQVGDVFVAEFEPESFDTVVMGELLEHLATPCDVLDRAASWLRPGGRLLVSVPHGYHPYHDHKGTFYLATLLEVLGKLFSVVEIDLVSRRYLCAVAVKPPRGQVPQPPVPDTVRRWEVLCDGALEKSQRQADRDRRALQAERKKLGERVSEYRAKIDQLQETTDRLYEQCHASRAEEESLRGSLAQAEQRAAELKAKVAGLSEAERRLRDELQARRAVSEQQARALANERKVRKDVEQRHRRLKEQRGYEIERLTEQADYYKAEIARLCAGVRYRLGDTFVRAAHSPLAALLLPFRLVKLFFVGLGRVRARRADARHLTGGAPAPSPAVAKATGPIPASSAPPSGSTGSRETSSAGPPTPARLDRVATLLPAYAPTPPDQIARKELKIAAVMDEFSWRSWQYEARLIPFTPKNWRSVLEEHNPDLLLIESAWSGLEDSWSFQLRDFGKRGDVVKYYALRDIVSWCRRREIPTVFYNKEDPPNFDVFIDAAKLFDYVFTSDANCIPDYRKHVGHARVFALPFAAQPQIHYPILAADRTGSVCFAGTWYRHRHSNRRESAESILRPALEFGLDIFDRMAHSKNESYRWPEVFQAAVRGALSYAEMVNAYKRYKVFLNINSVTNSPTMFSRRVFELLACGTPVISAYSEGIEKLLGGDVVLMSRDETTTRALLDRVLRDDEFRERLSLRGQRKVFSEHTYGHRLNAILETIGVATASVGRPLLALLAPVETAEQVAAAWENYHRQQYDRQQLIICARHPTTVTVLDGLTNKAADVSVVVDEAPWGRVLGAALDKVEGEYALALNPRDYYGPHYLTDMAHATLYVRDAAIGKGTLYQAADGKEPKISQAGREYRYVNQVCPWTLCLKTSDARQSATKLSSAQTPLEWWSRLMGAQERLYSADRFNYVRQGDGRPADRDEPAANPRFAASAARVMEPALV